MWLERRRKKFASPDKGWQRRNRDTKTMPINDERILRVAYKLALLPRLAGVHDVFHVSTLRKYIHDPDHILSYVPTELQEDMTYEEFPAYIVDREVRKLRSREIPYVKIHWSEHSDREETWELEDAMKERYPHLFEELA
ncbi:uncharacterized protein LOC109717100 [Ananas comosus]|uniref:Uncharacterized protein LOC109717100 n=1 Tax=Ananas comosus TaxID=4615 RepID=A0A6P5FZF0_ANACO|nr:uncharacterized protein LOC109717100 [Ananas comosus]